MKIIDHTQDNRKIAELNSEKRLIHNAQDALDLMGNLYYQGYDVIIIYAHHLPSDFFELKNGLAGEILQKFSNYRLKLAIIGDFKDTSKSFHDFIRESNKGNHIRFTHSLTQALA